MKLSLQFYPSLNKVDKRTGKIPIYGRFIVQRQKAELRLNVEISPQACKKWDPVLMRIREKENEINSLLDKISTKFEMFKSQNIFVLSSYTAKTLRNEVMGLQIKPTIRVNQFIEIFYKESVEVNMEITAGTKKNYKKTINHLNKYFEFKKITSPGFEDITVALAQGFKDYLLASYPEINKRPLTEPSAFDLIKKLRTIFERAVDQQLISVNPFKKVKLKSKSPKKPWLDIHSIRRISEMDDATYHTQSVYKNLFLFCVYTGLSYGDVTSLASSNLSYRDNRIVKLFIQRKKTGVITEMFLPEEAIKILNLYKEMSQGKLSGKVLPVRSNKEINVQLKIIATICNIPIPLTVHVARHSFRQLLSEAGVIEIAVIKRMMGHSNISDIDNTYYNVTESRLINARDTFNQYLKNNLL